MVCKPDKLPVNRIVFVRIVFFVQLLKACLQCLSVQKYSVREFVAGEIKYLVLVEIFHVRIPIDYPLTLLVGSGTLSDLEDIEYVDGPMDGSIDPMEPVTDDFQEVPEPPVTEP